MARGEDEIRSHQHAAAPPALAVEDDADGAPRVVEPLAFLDGLRLQIDAIAAAERHQTRHQFLSSPRRAIALGGERLARAPHGGGGDLREILRVHAGDLGQQGLALGPVDHAPEAARAGNRLDGEVENRSVFGPDEDPLLGVQHGGEIGRHLRGRRHRNGGGEIVQQTDGSRLTVTRIDWIVQGGLL